MASSDIIRVADVLVIGSGVAGSLCAYGLAKSGLAKKGIKVCVIEAGPEITRAEATLAFSQTHHLDFSAGFPNTHTAPRPDWQQPGNSPIQHVGSVKPSMEYLRVLGGTTWHWGGTTPRMLPSDFATQSLYGQGTDWPLDYSSLEPFYCQAERELGVAGDADAVGEPPRSAPFPLPPITPSYAEKQLSGKLGSLGVQFISRPSARNSIPYDGRPQCQGHSFCSPLCPIGAQYSASVHVQKAKDLGVEFITNTRVDKLHAQKNGIIDYIETENSRKEKKKLTADIIVLAANGLENPRLLLMSASPEFPEGIANRSGCVGRFYMDHPGISCRMLWPEPVYAGRGPESTLISYTFRDGELRKKRAGWSLSITNRVRLHDMTRQLLDKGYAPPELDHQIQYHASREIELDLQFEQMPHEHNRITLDWHKRDAAGQPGMIMNYGYSPYEQAGFSEGRAWLEKICQTLGIQRYEISEPSSRHHLMGSTRMGTMATDSVVDKHCRSHDHPNLYILGSSVFPTAGTANPTLTIAALSLRASAAIEQSLQLSRSLL